MQDPGPGDAAAPNVLFPPGHAPTADGSGDHARAPGFFRDLNLDQVVAAVTADRADYDLAPLYWSPLTDLDAIAYRHEVFADLERRELGGLVRRFAERRLVFDFAYRTKEMREDDQGLQHYYRARLFLNTADAYCRAVADLEAGLRAEQPHSRGLAGIADHLRGYVGSAEFGALRAEASRLETELGSVRYVLAIRGDRVTVAGYDDEPDYGARVARTFARFRQRRAGDTARPGDWNSYAGTGVLDLVAQLHPDLFAALDAFCDQHRDYLDPVVAAFDHDVQFYLAYLDHIADLRRAGLDFSYPRLSATDKTEQALDTFDLALARKLHPPRGRSADAATTADTATAADTAQDPAPAPAVVCNDISLTGPERILVVSGPNNGGKTTLARTFGQLHYLARLGCPVPGRDTRLFVCDNIFTHFEQAEDSTTMTGKLQAELDRLHADFGEATPASVIILNEVFNSTTAADALFLSRQILDRVTALDALCVCVSFLDELATFDDKTVSMVATVVPDDPATRTHRVVRRPADGRAYAHAVADKYGLGYQQLVAELGR